MSHQCREDMPAPLTLDQHAHRASSPRQLPKGRSWVCAPRCYPRAGGVGKGTTASEMPKPCVKRERGQGILA